MPWFIWLAIAYGVLVLVTLIWWLRYQRRPSTERDERLDRVDEELTRRGL